MNKGFNLMRGGFEQALAELQAAHAALRAERDQVVVGLEARLAEQDAERRRLEAALDDLRKARETAEATAGSRRIDLGLYELALTVA